MPWLPAFSFVVGTGSVDGLAAGFDGVVVVTRLGAVVVVGVDAVVGGLAGWSLPPEPGHDQQQDDDGPGDDHRARTDGSAREEAFAADRLTSVGVALLTPDGRVGVAQAVRADPPCPAGRLRDVEIGEPVVGIRRLRRVAIGDRSNVQRTADAT